MALTDLWAADVETKSDRPRPEKPKDAVSSGDIFGAHWTTGSQEFAGAKLSAEVNAYTPLVELLERELPDQRSWVDRTLGGPRYTTATRSGSPVNTDAVWRDVARLRTLRNPRLLADLPATDAVSFRAHVEKQELTKRRSAQDVIARQQGFGQNALGLVADIATGVADPVNLLTLPLGGGGAGVKLTTFLAREALLNSALEVVSLPVTADARARFGEDYTARDMATDVAIAAGAGVVLGGAARVGGAVIDDVASRASSLGEKAYDAALPPERRLARQLGRETLADVTDADLAAHVAKTVPIAARTPEMRAALALVERQAGIDATNPFGKGRDLETHVALIENIMQSWATPPGAPVSRVMYAPPVPREPAARGPIAQTANAAPGRDVLMQRVARVESGGKLNARNPRSSATGKYQFVDDTWLRYYKRELGAGGLSDAAILAKRGDGALQDRLMAALTADNAAVLRRAGHADTAGNLYLAHFAGSGGATRLLGAAPGTPVARLLSAEAINANPFLRGMSAGDVVAWADRKMGGAGERSGRSAAVFADVGDDVPAPRDVALDAERPAGAQVDIDADDIRAVMAAPETPELRRDTFASDADWRIAQRAVDAEWRTGGEALPEPAARYATTDADEVRRLIQNYIDDAKKPKIDAARIARQLELDPVQVESALAAETGAFNGKSRLVYKKLYKVEYEPLKSDSTRRRRVRSEVGQRLQRRWQMTGDDRPLSLREMIAKRGGLRDDEGHALGQSRGLQGMTRGGMFLRKNGMSIDDALQLAVESRYLNDVGADGDGQLQLSIADLLEAIERDASPDPSARVYSTDDDAAVADWAERRNASVADGAAQNEARAAAAAMDIEFDDAEIDAIVEMARALDDDYGAAVVAALNGRHALTIEKAFEQSGDLDYVAEYDEFGTLIRDGEPDGAEVGARESGERPGAAGGDESGSDAGAGRTDQGGSLRDEVDAESARPADLAALEAFSDPAGPASKAVAASIEHDLRAEIARTLEYLPQPEVTARRTALADDLERGSGTARDTLGERRAAELANATWNPQKLATITDDELAAFETLRDERQSAYSIALLREKAPTSELAAAELVRAEAARVRQGWAPVPADVIGDMPERIYAPSAPTADVPRTNDAAALDLGTATDPAIADRQRQEVALKAASPMRKPVEQDGTMGLGLFDATDQGFRLDLDGTDRPAADVLGELDGEAAAIKRIRDCL